MKAKNTNASVPVDCIVVNKEIFLSAMEALTVFLEVSQGNYEQIHGDPRYNKQIKQVLLAFLADHIDAASRISLGFEASIEFGNPTLIDKASAH